MQMNIILSIYWNL